MGATVKQYTSVEEAHKFLNENMFSGQLCDIMIAVDERDANSEGHYYHSKQYFNKNDLSKVVRKIKLNPDLKETKDDKFILLVLAHQMMHQWQYEKGIPPRSGTRYHNKEWLDKMRELGVNSQVNPDGQKTKDTPIENGLFEQTYNKFKELGNVLLPWRMIPPKLAKTPTYTCKCPNWEMQTGYSVSHLKCSICGEFLGKKEEITQSKKLLLTL